MKWRYVLDGETIGLIERPKDDVPYLGYPITWVGRNGMGPVEEFVVAEVDADAAVLSLRKAPR